MQYKVKGKKPAARTTPVIRLRIRSTRFVDQSKKSDKLAARGRTFKGGE